MDDPVEITDEELDRLIAEVSGDCDVEEGDDFDIVSELDELSNTSELPAVISKKDVTASSKAVTDKDNTKKEDETALKEAKQTVDVAKKIDEKTVSKAKETVAVPAEIKNEPTEIVKKKDDAKTVKEIGEKKDVVKTVKEIGEKKDNAKTVKEIVEKKDNAKTIKGIGEAVASPAKRKDEPLPDIKKKGEKSVKENIAVPTKVAEKGDGDIEKKKVIKEVKSSAAEGRNVPSDGKKIKEKSSISKNKESVEGGEKTLIGQSQKAADDKKILKEEKKIKSTEEASPRMEEEEKKKSPVVQSLAEGSSANGNKGGQNKAGVPTTSGGESSTSKAALENKSKNKASTGGNIVARDGKEIKTEGKLEATKEKSIGEERPREKRLAASPVSVAASDIVSSTSSVKGTKVVGRATVGTETLGSTASVGAPVEGANDGNETVRLPADRPSLDASESASGKVEKATVTSQPAASGDAETTSEEKTRENPAGEVKNVDGQKKKGGWGWNSIGSWGSSVLNQVGGSLYHVLETVESSFVEPENKDLSKSNLNQDRAESITREGKMGERGAVSDVLLPSATEIESKVPGTDGKSSKALVGSGTKDGDRNKEQENDAATSSDVGKNEETGVEVTEEAPNEKKKSKKKLNISKGQEKDNNFQEQSWFSGWGLSTITGVVQQTGKKVVSTGMDVLENISRKTMSVLTEDAEDGVVPLSPSASSPSESRKKKSNTRTIEKSKAQMLRKCFDDCQGMAHFDALTDLSQTSQEKLTKQLERISGDWLSAVKADLALIKEASDLGGMDWEENFGNADHDFRQLIKDFVSQLSLSIDVQKLFNVQETTSKWLSSCLQENSRDKKYSVEDIHKMAILMFADFTATGIAQFHKIAQLLLVDYSTPILSYKFRALSLAGLTKVLCTEIWIEARKFTECLSPPELAEPPDMMTVSLITNLTLEASNCNSCLQDGYHLLLPIVQLSALKVHPLMSDCSEIANLELLQMLSGMSRTKVSKILNQLSSDARQRVQTDLSAIEAAFDLSCLGHEYESDKADHAFGPVVLECLRQIGVDINSQKLLRAQERTREWLLSHEMDSENLALMTPSDINQMALKSLNDLTFCSIELFHHVGQVLLMENPHEISSYGTRASAVKDLAKVLCLEVGCLSTKFTDCILRFSTLNQEKLEKSIRQMQESTAESLSPFVTNIYLEASNSTTYIQDGFQLLLPIMQLALFKAHPACAGVED